ncbi:MAG: DeoR/GlpR family DNA-binding transcription regulator [Nitriliruptoraceae bacterium]
MGERTTERASTASPNGQLTRLRTIERHLFTDGSVRIQELAVALSVSEMTIRRDLDELEELGVARRVRGGAIAIGPQPFAERHRANARAKGIIASKLAGLIPDHGTVAFDASTTVHRYASTLEGARDLHVVTNGIDTFEALVQHRGVAATLTGGSREPQTGSLVGAAAATVAEEFLFELLVCSAAGVDPALGSSESSADEAAVKRAMSRTSGRIVLAVDHSKLGARSPARLFRPQEIDVLVTDLDPNSEPLAPYRETVREVR